MADPAASALPLTSWEYKEAIGLAVAASLIFALIEIPSKAKTTSLRATLVSASFFYWAVLGFGNVVTTLLASAVVVKMPSALSDYYFLLSAFFGVFAFETILKNTNITMFDKGVLTIQNWIDKALNAAAAAAIDKQETLKQKDEAGLIEKLMKYSEKDINTRILNKMGGGKVKELDDAAYASGADPKLYKIFQLVTTLSSSERTALLKQSKLDIGTYPVSGPNALPGGGSNSLPGGAPLPKSAPLPAKSPLPLPGNTPPPTDP